MDSHTKLFSRMKIGQHDVSHRVVMAPLTRFRAHEGSHAPLPFVREYYAQRASTPGTFLISEGTLPCARGGGLTHAPGIWSDEQISAWKHVVEGVHKAGGIIFMQLFAMGRVADPSVLENEGGWKVKAPSAIPLNPQDDVQVNELSEEEIWTFVKDFAQGARNAVEGAGFDGVEVHAANGYLIDQFTQDNSNQRTDAWGGSIENRSRFALEVTKAVVEAVGPGKVGFRVSPWSDFQGMKMTDATSQFTYLIEKLKPMQLAYLHMIEARISGSIEGQGTESLDPFIQIWAGTSPILLAGGYGPESAKRAVDQDYQDYDIGIVFGRHFISTPDLVFRIRHNIPLNTYDRSLFYAAKQEEGYIDYPFSKEFLVEQRLLAAAGGE